MLFFAGGFVLGLDLQPLPLTIPLPSHVQLLRQDVFDWSIPSEYRGSFDVLLSDMAPSTSGIKLLDANSSHELCHQALQIAKLILKPNGTLVMVSANTLADDLCYPAMFEAHFRSWLYLLFFSSENLRRWRLQSSHARGRFPLLLDTITQT